VAEQKIIPFNYVIVHNIMSMQSQATVASIQYLVVKMLT